MSWLEKGISSLKGQITNLAKEVLAEEDTESSGDAPSSAPGDQAAATAATAPAEHEHASHHGDGYFGKALSGLPLFARSSPEAPSPDDQMRQHCSQLESTVQRLLQQLEEVSETRDKEALELATLRRELRLRGAADSGPASGSGSASGSGPGSGHSDSPQLPDDSAQHSADGTGVSPALSDDGFTKLDPSETELWEATQELSQSLEAQIELHKKELEKYHQMKQDWTLEKSNLENSVLQLQKELNALQDWQSPDPDFANEDEGDLKNTLLTLQKENEILQKEKLEIFERLKSVETKLSESEKERIVLSNNVDELDAQNQEIQDQFSHIKQGTQVKYEALRAEHEKLLSHVEELQKENKNINRTQEEKNDLEKKLCSLEAELQTLKSEHKLVQQKNKELEKETDKLSALKTENNELLFKFSSLESENHNIMSKMDSIQLDYESLEVKYSTVVSENETLKIKLGAVQCDLDSAKSELCEGLKADGTSEHSTAELSSMERYVIDKLRKIVSLEIPVEYCRDIAEKDEASGKELEDQLDMVAALVKMTVDLRWKKDTLERNLMEYTRQLRDMSAQLNGRDKQIAKLEEECVVLRENMESLLDGLNVAPEKGMLPSIPETSEAGEDELSETAYSLEQHGMQRNEEKDFGKTIGKLENEIEILREARSTLEHETKRLRGELQELSSRLRSSESMLRNQDNLENEVERRRKECENLRSVQNELQTENSQLREEAEMARFGQDSLQAEVSEWKTIADSATLESQDATRAKELLVAEVAELKATLNASESLSTRLEHALKTKSTLEAEIAQLKESISSLEESNKSLDNANHTIEELKTEIADLRQKLTKADSTGDDKVAELSSRIDSLQAEKSNLDHSLSELGSENAGLCEHIMTLQLKCDSLSADLACKASSEYDNTQNFLHEKQALEEQVNRMTCNYETVKKDFEELSNVKLSLQNDLEQLQQSFKVICEENESFKKSLQEKLNLETSVSDQLEAMSVAKRASEQEVRHLQEELQKVQGSPQNANNNPQMIESLERKLHSMLEEREQILSVLNDKTRENGILRSENQSLLAAMSSQSENHSPSSPSDQSVHLVQQLNQLQVERDQLISTVQVKHDECLRYHAEIVRLSALLDQIKHSSTHPQIHQSSDENKNVDAMATPVGDPTNKSQEIIALEAKCAELAASLQQGQTQNAFLQNEMQEQHEKEGILTRELERLRAHLMEVEETYTAEALRLEEQVQDLQGKLNTAEERLKNVSTAHTSASILANQHVETLQGQSRLIGQQRDELQSKLGAVEDREQKNAAALRNLQAVLEQFQRDKERDLGSMTEKLRLELQAAQKKHGDLYEEIKMLKSQLTEAKEGLSAAARLGAQLDKKSETINSLKEQISQQQKEIKGAEERVKAASQSVEGKVDKSLVKNLVVGLLTAPANTRSPALRVVASVLDFNQGERQRVGLEHGTAHNEQSLSEAFVRFLESESRPQMQLRLLPEASSKPNPDGKKDSHGSNATGESPVRRSPLLSEVVLPTLAPLPVGRSSSSILKDVLKNDV